MFEKFLFLFDLKKVLIGEIIGFFRYFRLKNPNQKNLFKLQTYSVSDTVSPKKKRLLIISLTNSNFTINLESLFAKYFNLNEYSVFFLTNFKERRAVKTFRYIRGNILFHHFIYFRNGLKFLFRKLPRVNSAEDLKKFSYKNINVGLSIYSTVSAKVRMGQLDFSDKRVKRLSRKFLWRSIVYLETAEEIFSRIKPDTILSLEKGYVGNNEIFTLAVDRGMEFIQWCGCQEPNALVFKRFNKNNIKNHPFSVSQETWQEFLNVPWQEEWGKKVYDLFQRGYLSQQWFKYKTLMDNSVLMGKEEFIKKYNLDADKKIAILFSHVMWDANLFYGQDLFEKGFEQWLIESAKEMLKNSNINWLVKIHPANKFKHNIEKISGEYREIAAIKKEFGGIPENIKIIYPEDNINPYALFSIIDYGVTVRGTIGAELPCFGISLLTAGTGRYSNRGFTVDSNSKEEYLEKLFHLEDLPKLNEEQKRLALLHGYLLFFKRPFKFSSFQEKSSGLTRDIEILIDKPEQGIDFQKLIDWAINSKKEDILS